MRDHTDDQGAARRNQEQSRADAVRAGLESRGIAPERLAGVGLGEQRPIATHRTAGRGARNRREEFHLSRAACQETPRP